MSANGAAVASAPSNAAAAAAAAAKHHKSSRHSSSGGGGDKPGSSKKRKASSEGHKKSSSKSHKPTPPIPENKKKTKSKFKCDLEFRNQIPEPPTGAKLLHYPTNQARLYEYSATALDENFKADIPTDRLIGIPMDLVDIEQYNRPPNVKRGELHPADAALFPEHHMSGTGGGGVSTSSSGSGTGVGSGKAPPKLETLLQGHTFSWLRRVEYLSNNLYDAVTKQYSEHDRRSDEALKIAAAKLQDKTDKEKQIKSIEDTFRAAKATPHHPTKPGLRVQQIFEVFPDDDMTKTEYTYVHFLNDAEREVMASATTVARAASAAAVDDSVPAEVREATRSALLRTYPDVDEVGKPASFYHGLYIPTSAPLPAAGSGATVVAGGGSGSDGGQPHEWVREFVRNPAPPPKENDNYFMIFNLSDADGGGAGGGSIRYSRYQKRLHLRKRALTDKGAPVSQRPTFVGLHQTPFTFTAPPPQATPSPSPPPKPEASESSSAAAASAAETSPKADAAPVTSIPVAATSIPAVAPASDSASAPAPAAATEAPSAAAAPPVTASNN